jgi:peptidoglycan/xylan/chitin deacetylase (PgdA/CDA1 family)
MRSQHNAIRSRKAIVAVVAATIMVVGVARSAPAAAVSAHLDGPPAGSVAFDSDPRIASMLPTNRAVTPIGTMMVVDFTQPMRPSAVRVDIAPATKFWWHWSSAQRLEIQPQHNWLTATSYRVTVTGLAASGRALAGQREYDFRTGRAPVFSDSCAMRELVYHINGRPKPDELSQNFVDWTAFKLQITQLQQSGHRFGNPDQVCAPGNEDMVSVQFDDGWATQFPAAQILQARGITAFFAITLGNLDKPGYMTRAQVRLLPQMGMLVGSHLMTHDCLTTTAARLEPAARQQYFDLQLRTSQQQLEQITGRPVHFLVYPYGCFDVAVAREVQKYYWAAWTGLAALPMPADLQSFARQRLTVTNDVRFK